jgi:hypothetical protein
VGEIFDVSDSPLCLFDGLGLFGVAHLDEKGHSSDCLTRIFRYCEKKKREA